MHVLVVKHGVLLLSLLCSFAWTASAANFANCAQKVRGHLPDINNTTLTQSEINNYTITTGDWGPRDPIYHGVIRGFHGQTRPLTLTLQGCYDVCTGTPQPTDVNGAFQILTTWVLPVIALLSSVPYESNNNIKNLEAFANWIGAPAAALTITIWNILMTRRCRKLASHDSRDTRIIKDCVFVLSCINQYQYPRRGRRSGRRQVILSGRRMSFSHNGDRIRDKALLRGVLFPLLRHPLLKEGQPLRIKLENITHHLAFQLRLQRRRGVFPLALSIIWFLFAFVVSVVTAFAQLGDNTTAHSLALGLLLSWLPVLVVATIVDRNPVSATRCGILIERWLYTVDMLFTEAGLQQDSDDAMMTRPRAQSNDIRLSPISPSPCSTSLLGDQDDRMSLQRERSHDFLLPPTTPPPRHVSPMLQNYDMRQTSPVRRKPVAGDVPFILAPRESTDIVRDDASDLRAISPTNAGNDVERGPEPYGRSDRSDVSTLRNASPAPPPTIRMEQWRQDSDTTPFEIDEFVGQGRRLRYCAVADTVLDMYEAGHINMKLPDNETADEFKRMLPSRPWMWYATWVVSQVLVTMSFAMAFLVSFKTPTIGLGCRSLSYLIWWLLSLVSWVVLLIWQEPPRIVRILAWIPDALAAFALFIIMGLQLTGGLNQCICKVSVFGSSAYGGYMDFENGEFYHHNYDVKKMWGIATAFGLTSCTLAIVWFYRRWSRDSMLWKFREDHQPEVIDGVDLHWLT